MLQWLRRWLTRAPATPAREAPRRTAPRAAAVPPPPALTDEAVLAAIDAPGTPPDKLAVEALEQRIVAEVAANAPPIPPFPAAAARVFELVDRPKLDLNELVRVLHWEPAIVASILAVARSAVYGRAPLDDLREAVVALGMREVAALACALSTRSLFDVESRAEYNLYPEHWQRAHRETLVIAFTAAWLAQTRGVQRHDRVLLRGVLAGAGRTTALRALAAQLLDGRCPLRPDDDVIATAVDNACGEVVALSNMNLPETLASANDPAQLVEQQLVELVTGIVQLKRSLDPAVAARVRERLMALELDASWVRVIIRQCDESTAKVAVMFDARPARAA